MQTHRGQNVRIIHEERILEAIDQLRRRKARPDADRICNYMLRKFAVDARDTIADLHRLIEAEKVIQVDYKGNTSYRNAQKWTRLQLYKNRPEGFVKEKLNSAMVAGAVAELVVEEPDYLDQGVPSYRLIDQLLEGVSNPTSRRMAEEFLAKEVSNGNLTKLPNGNYSLVASLPAASMPALDAVEESQRTTSPPTSQPAQQTKQQEDKVPPKQPSPPSQALQQQPNNKPRSEGSDKQPSDVIEMQDFAQSQQKVGDLYEFYEEPVTAQVSEEDLSVPESCLENSNSQSPKTSPTSKDNNRGTAGGEAVNSKENDIAEEAADSVKDEESLGKNCDEQKLTGDDERGRKTPEIKEEFKDATLTSPPNLKKRKQRLLVRNDDSYDVQQFDDVRKDKKSDKSEKNKKEEERRLSEEPEDDEAGRSSTNPSPTPSNTNTAVSFRSARRKRVKKVFDPSDNYVKRKRNKMTNAPPKNAAPSPDCQEAPKPKPKDKRKCSVCMADKSEALIACRDCTVKAHPSCIYSPEELPIKSKKNWTCNLCKTCIECNETAENARLITCVSCDDACHQYCLFPPISDRNLSRWVCGNCVHKQFDKVIGPTPPPKTNSRSSTPPGNVPILPPVLSPQVSPNRASPEQMDEEVITDAVDPNIPDASDWSSEQVYQYFSRLFPKEAEVFRQQDIDGPSLLLLKRSDVLTGLDLLLGPALKIYRHVLKLQVRKDDPKLYWL